MSVKSIKTLFRYSNFQIILILRFSLFNFSSPQKDKDAERQFRWLHCAMTQERLQKPIVMCGLGRLYSKQNVIEQLLEKDKMPESTKHIKSLKDIKDLNLTSNPAFKDEDKHEGLDTRHAPFICKLIGLEMSGKFRFIALWSCGCVYSERAFKETKSSTCAICQQPYTADDIVILNGTDEEIEEMRMKMDIRVAKRKTKKQKKVEVTATESEATKEVDVQSEASEQPSTSKPSTSKKIVAPKRLIGAKDIELQDPEIKKLKTDFSVSKDPKATEVFKSIFTSHKSEQEQDRAHWVTYNPFYNWISNKF